MAKRRPLSADPMVRSLIRRGVRAGLSDLQIRTEVEASFPRATEGAVNRITSQERGRQTAVDKVMSRDFRKRTNLHAIVGCGAGEKVRGRITVEWEDPQTGHTRRYGQTLELKNQGVLGTILNEAIEGVLQDARGKGYQPPRITSGMRSGRETYRIEYLECV